MLFYKNQIFLHQERNIITTVFQEDNDAKNVGMDSKKTQSKSTEGNQNITRAKPRFCQGDGQKISDIRDFRNRNKFIANEMEGQKGKGQGIFDYCQ